MTTTAERVIKIVIEHLGVDEGKVTEEASFIDDLGILLIPKNAKCPYAVCDDTFNSKER